MNVSRRALNVIDDILSACCALSAITYKFTDSGHMQSLFLFGNGQLVPTFVCYFQLELLAFGTLSTVRNPKYKKKSLEN
jgi:hypothetical protein